MIQKLLSGGLNNDSLNEMFSNRFVLSLADVDKSLMMEGDSLVWTSKDVVIVLEHQNEKIPLRSEISVLSTDFN